MTTRSLLVLFGGIFLLGLLPLMLLQTSGLAGAGMAAGVMFSFQYPFYLLGLPLAGVLAVFWAGRAFYIFSASLLLMFLAGNGVGLAVAGVASAVLLAVASGLLCGALLSRVRSGIAIGAALFLSAVGFAMGHACAAAIPVIAAPGYYVTGALFSALLLMGIGVSLGFMVSDMLNHYYGRLRENPGVASLLSMFGLG